MKRLGSSDSLGALMSICPSSTDELNQDCSPIYTRGFQTMLEGLDEEGCVEESGHVSEKKRRLSIDQVKALEKNFEVENKLEPERKVKLAQELSLQPRQVAVWFQNRRARYKTKQLERDYGILKASYDNLKQNYDTLQRDNESLLKEIREMKSKLSGDGKTESKVFVKEEAMVSDTEEQSKAETPVNSLAKFDEVTGTELDFHNFIGNHTTTAPMETGSVFLDFKDGSSDSTDSSAILNEENNSPIQFLEIQNGSSTSMNCSFQISDSKPSAASIILGDDAHKNYQAQFVKIEEHNFFGEESCSTLFSDDQAPTLHWYCADQWN